MWIGQDNIFVQKAFSKFYYRFIAPNRTQNYQRLHVGLVMSYM